MKAPRAEGKITWYTSLAGNSYKELAAAFEAKYPGVKVESYRATRAEMSARIMAESQAQRYIVDTIETTIPLLKLLKDNSMLVPYYFPTQGEISRPRQRKRSQRSRLLGHRPRIAHRSCLQQKLYTGKARAEKLPRVIAPRAEGQNRLCRQRHRRHRHRRDAQVSRRGIRQETQEPESRDSQCFGARSARHGDLRRSRRLADNLSQSRRSIAESRRAHRMDPDGRRAVQFRLYRGFGQSAAPACGAAAWPISFSAQAAKKCSKNTNTAIRQKITASSAGIPSKG